MTEKDFDALDVCITDQERELAQSALSEFNKNNYSVCLQNLAKLESRSQDPKVAHNKAVAEFYKSDQKKVEAFKKNLNAVFTQAKLKQDVLEDVEQCILHYNQAALLFHQKKYGEALRIVDRIYKFIEPMEENLAKKVCLLLIELYIVTQQQTKALTLIQCIENQFVNNETKPNKSDKNKIDNKEKIIDATIEPFRTKLIIFRAKCYIMNHSLKAAIREVKTISSLEGQNTSTLCLRAQIEYLKGNFKAAIKIFNSSPTDNINVIENGDSSTVIFYNNMGVIHHAMGKTHLACHYFRQALKEDQLAVNSFVKVDGELNRPLYAMGCSRYHEIMYNLGIALLHANQVTQAFDCLITAVQKFHRNSRLWLRIAECCITLHKNSNETDFSPKRQKEIVDKVVGSGKHRKVILTSHLSKDTKYSTESQSYAVPVATLEFASLCLRNAYLLLPSEVIISPVPIILLPGGVQPPPPPPTPGPAPSNPLSRKEIAGLKNSVLAASAYVSLCLGDFVLTLEHAQDLLAQPKLSGVHKMLGHLYAAEALILMDKIPEAIAEHLDPEYVKDISLAFPGEAPTEEDEIPVNTKPPTKWFPENLTTAHALMQYNLAVALAFTGEFEKCSELLKRIWHSTSSTRKVPIHVVMLFLYSELQSGHVEVARSFIKQYYTL